MEGAGRCLMADSAYRILVTGSRTWDAEGSLRQILIGVASEHPELIVVHGACPRGADAMADTWAKDYGFAVERHAADWDRYGKPAGFRRNAEMVALGADVCVAFIRNGSRGATHCADLAQEAGIPVRRFTQDDAALWPDRGAAENGL